MSATFAIGTLVNVQPWHDGNRLPAQDGVTVEWWGPEPGWVVWFYGDGTVTPEPGPTAQGFFEYELTATGTVADLPEITRHRMRETLRSAEHVSRAVSYADLANMIDATL